MARAELSLREYGFFCDLTRYSAAPPNNIPLERHPFAAKIQVSYPTKPVLIQNNDIYFRGYDNAFPDFWREDEWAREFDNYVANGNLPEVEFVRFMHDHTGSFTTSIDGVNTAELDHADNDYAVGLPGRADLLNANPSTSYWATFIRYPPSLRYGAALIDAGAP